MVVGNERLQKLSDTFVTLERKYENVLWNLIKDILELCIDLNHSYNSKKTSTALKI